MKYRFMPYQELVIHEILEQDNATFFEDVARQSITPQGYIVPSVNWIDGLAFLALPMPATEDIVKEQLAGRVHYAAVVFTKIDFTQEVKAQIGRESYPVRLRKANNNDTLVGMIKFVREKPSPDN